MRKLTKEEQIEYDRLVANAVQTKLELEAFEKRPVVYGYARVSTQKQAKDGNSLESQEAALRAAGAVEIFSDAYTGTSTNRPELERLLSELKSGDTVVVTKLDRVARSVQQGIELINNLCDRGIKVHVLNLGLLDSSPNGKLIRNVMLCFAEFERDMILQRTREGKQVAKQKPGYKEGRPKKFTAAQLKHAVALLDEFSYSQVSEMTGISKATLTRAKRAVSID